MITLTELYKLLALNESMANKALVLQDLKAILRLQLHRSLLKDCIIEQLKITITAKLDKAV